MTRDHTTLSSPTNWLILFAPWIQRNGSIKGSVLAQVLQKTENEAKIRLLVPDLKSTNSGKKTDKQQQQQQPNNNINNNPKTTKKQIKKVGVRVGESNKTKWCGVSHYVLFLQDKPQRDPIDCLAGTSAQPKGFLQEGCRESISLSTAACAPLPTLISCCSKFVTREGLTSLTFWLHHLPIGRIFGKPDHTACVMCQEVTYRHGCTVKAKG